MKSGTIEQRVDNLEVIFGRFLNEMSEYRKQAEERDMEYNKRAEERDREYKKQAEERDREFRHLMEERDREYRKRAEERDKRAEERNRQAEERNKLAEERLANFERDMRELKRDLNKKWGDLANKMGTIIEDLLAPNLQRLAREHFGFEQLLDFMIRRRRRHPERPGVREEFDTIVVGEEAVILGEAKSSPSLEYAREFAEKREKFHEYFPEYANKRLIMIFGSWSIPDEVVARLTQLGIYAMQMGEDTMELVNAAELEG